MNEDSTKKSDVQSVLQLYQSGVTPDEWKDPVYQVTGK